MLKGKKLSKEHRKNISKGLMGHTYSLATRRKMSKTHTGKIISKATREKMKFNNSGSKCNFWRGGKAKLMKHIYVYICAKEHPHCNKAGYVREHRLVMEKHLGRYLRPEETIHHINENIHDNRIKNLMLFSTKGEHIKYHIRLRREKCQKKIGKNLLIL